MNDASGLKVIKVEIRDTASLHALKDDQTCLQSACVKAIPQNLYVCIVLFAGMPSLVWDQSFSFSAGEPQSFYAHPPPS